MIGNKRTFDADSLPGRLAWSYDCVCAIGALPVSDHVKSRLLAVFRLWLRNGGELALSDFAAAYLIQPNGRLMPFFRFAARYAMNHKRWQINGLGDIGKVQLIKALSHHD